MISPFVARLLLVLGLCLASHPALAGVIELSASVVPKATDKGLELKVRLANQGNEAARELNLEARLPGLGAAATMAGPKTLAPGARRELRMVLRQRQHADGLYPVILKVRYRDANQYPFSTLAYGLYRIGSPVEPQVLIRGIPSRLGESGGEAAFALANLSPDPLAIEVFFFAPDELRLGDSRLKTRLAEGDKVILENPLENRSALIGASCPVIALARYEWQGRVLTAPASTQVSITAKEGIGYNWWLPGLALAGFAVLTFWLALHPARKNKASKGRHQPPGGARRA